MKRSFVTMAALALMTAACIAASAAPSPLGPFIGRSFDSMGATSEANVLVSSAYNFNNTFTGVISSSVWNLAGGDYLYLYQANNTGDSALEIMCISPFYNIKEVGYLTSHSLTGFLAGGSTPLQLPENSGNYAVTYDAAGGANVSFGYYGALGGAVASGHHTAVLYLISSSPAVTGFVSVIDSGTATAPGWTTSTVPEPSSLLALAGGLAPLLMIRRRRT